MHQTTELKPRVLMVNGLALTTSLAVAMHFDKDHRNVMRGIRDYIGRQNNREFVDKHFFPDSYENERGKTYESYRLTEQAFALISFGFTGAKAEAWQIAYVEAFTAMKAHILDKEAKAAAEQTAKYLEQSELLRLQLTLAEKNLQVVTAECQNLQLEKQNLTLRLDIVTAEKEAATTRSLNTQMQLSSVETKLKNIMPSVLPEDSKHFPIIERQRIFNLLICDHKAALLDMKKKGFYSVQDTYSSMIGRESMLKLAHCTSPSEAVLVWMILRHCGLEGSMMIGNNDLLSYTKPYIRTTETIKQARARLEARGLIHVLRNKYRHNGPTGYKVARARLLEVLRGFDQDWKEHVRRPFPFVTSIGRPADTTNYPSSSVRNWFGATPAAHKPVEG